MKVVEEPGGGKTLGEWVVESGVKRNQKMTVVAKFLDSFRIVVVDPKGS